MISKKTSYSEWKQQNKDYLVNLRKAHRYCKSKIGQAFIKKVSPDFLKLWTEDFDTIMFGIYMLGLRINGIVIPLYIGQAKRPARRIAYHIWKIALVKKDPTTYLPVLGLTKGLIRKIENDPNIEISVTILQRRIFNDAERNAAEVNYINYFHPLTQLADGTDNCISPVATRVSNVYNAIEMLENGKCNR